MSSTYTDDGCHLYYEETGKGSPVVFVHEFAGDHRSWAPQIQAMSRRHRCIVYAARGYPPSDVPQELAAYSQARAAEDLLAVMDATGMARAHVVGISMGGFAALHFGLKYTKRVLSLTLAGVGYGALSADQEAFRAVSRAAAEQFETQGSAAYGHVYAAASSRIPFQNKDPHGWQQFADALAKHDAVGAALTLRGVQAQRPALDTLTDSLRALNLPTLIIAGDEDDHSLEPSLFLKRTLPASGLLVLPKSGHNLNQEEPVAFNRAVLDFISLVEAGRWDPRDPRTSGSVLKLS